ncbi:MAG: hypothetical protein LBM75_00770 [Myxococcales bacterium]|jgi:hypothetical protein|nr:hypothetical protein [Myxococcales bacterium]
MCLPAVGIRCNARRALHSPSQLDISRVDVDVERKVGLGTPIAPLGALPALLWISRHFPSSHGICRD